MQSLLYHWQVLPRVSRRYVPRSFVGVEGRRPDDGASRAKRIRRSGVKRRRQGGADPAEHDRERLPSSSLSCSRMTFVVILVFRHRILHLPLARRQRSLAALGPRHGVVSRRGLASRVRLRLRRPRCAVPLVSETGMVCLLLRWDLSANKMGRVRPSRPVPCAAACCTAASAAATCAASSLFSASQVIRCDATCRPLRCVACCSFATFDASTSQVIGCMASCCVAAYQPPGSAWSCCVTSSQPPWSTASCCYIASSEPPGSASYRCVTSSEPPWTTSCCYVADAQPLGSATSSSLAAARVASLGGSKYPVQATVHLHLAALKPRYSVSLGLLRWSRLRVAASARFPNSSCTYIFSKIRPILQPQVQSHDVMLDFAAPRFLAEQNDNITRFCQTCCQCVWVSSIR